MTHETINRKTENMKTTVLLFRYKTEWILCRYKGDTIPSRNFPTAKEARIYAKAKGWSVRRAVNCDS